MGGEPRHAVPSVPENTPHLFSYAIIGVALRPDLQLFLVPQQSGEVQCTPLPRSLFESILHFLELPIEVGIIFYQFIVMPEVNPPSADYLRRMAFHDLL